MAINRVLVAPLNYSHRQRGQVEAFREVFGKDNVREFDFMAIHRQGDNPNTRLIACALEFKPDWIWLQVQGVDVIHGTTIERIKREMPRCLITHWMGDLRLEVAPGLADICKTTHVTLLSNADKTQYEMYRKAGAREVAYLQIGLDPEDILTTRGNDWDPPFEVPDVVFCGGYYGHVPAFAQGTKERLEAIRALLASGIHVGVVGTGWPSDIPVIGACTPKQQVHVYKRAKVALSINHFNHLERYYSDRHLIAMASGTPVAAFFVPGLEHEFCDGQECLMWDSTGRLISAVKNLLDGGPFDWKTDGDGYRMEMWANAAAIGASGQRAVLQRHTWPARIRRLVEPRDRAVHWHELVVAGALS
jgi:hypothetical protein